MGGEKYEKIGSDVSQDETSNHMGSVYSSELSDEVSSAMHLAYVKPPPETYRVTPTKEFVEGLDKDEFQMSYNYFIIEILKHMPLHSAHYMSKRSDIGESSGECTFFTYAPNKYDKRLLGFLIRCMYSITAKYNVNFFYVSTKDDFIKVAFENTTSDGEELDMNAVSMELYNLGQETLKDEVQELLKNLSLIKTTTFEEINTNVALRNRTCYLNKVYDIFKVSSSTVEGNFCTEFYCLTFNENEKTYIELNQLSKNKKKQPANVSNTLLLVESVRRKATDKFCKGKIKFVEYDDKESLACFVGRPAIQVPNPKVNQETINQINMFLNVAAEKHFYTPWLDLRPENGKFTPVPTDLVPVELDSKGWKYSKSKAKMKICDVIEAELIVKLIECNDKDEAGKQLLTKRIKCVKSELERLLFTEEYLWMRFTHVDNVKGFIHAMYIFISTDKEYIHGNIETVIRGFTEKYKEREPKNLFMFKEYMNTKEYFNAYSKILLSGTKNTYVKHDTHWQNIEKE